jgi:hypothetical protein
MVFGPGDWLSSGWAKDGRIIALRRTPDRTLEIDSVELPTGARATIVDMGPYPAAFAFGELSGVPPLSRISAAPDGTSVLISILHVNSNLWTISGF